MLEVSYPHKTPSKTTTTINYRDHLKKESQERKKNLLHLIFKYLLDNNFHTSAETLQNETQTGLQYEVCDNIDLEIILQEYESYYYTKFQKNPKILKKTENPPLNTIKKEKKKPEKPNSYSAKPVQKSDDFQFEIVNLSQIDSTASIDTHKSLINYEHYSSEWREIADQIIKQIVPKTHSTSFADCISLDQTVERLKEAIIYPLAYPALFENVPPSKGILLFGPPGTGKTLLAKALASESNATLINVTSSAFTSKWRGESEKLVKVLFDVAKLYAPTTIFIDEIDALGGNNLEHEASRRFKSELLTQIDGIVQSVDVFVLATSNTPWSIDRALLRRFEKRILVPLPDAAPRANIFRYYFKKMNQAFMESDLRDFVINSGDFSGSDLRNVCREVQMILVRDKLSQLKNGIGKKCAATRNANAKDVLNALAKIRPACSKEFYQKYLQWEKAHGAL